MVIYNTLEILIYYKYFFLNLNIEKCFPFNLFLTNKKLKRNVVKYIYCLLNEKKGTNNFGQRTWCTKKTFGYCVINHGYSLMSSPGQLLKLFIFVKY